MLSDLVTGGLSADIERALEDETKTETPALDREALRALDAELPELGWFGILVAASDAPAPAADFFEDILSGLHRGLNETPDDRAHENDEHNESQNSTPADPESLEQSVIALIEREIESHSARTEAKPETESEHEADQEQPKTAAHILGPRNTPRRRIAEALYDHFALEEHALFVEDVERVLELLRTGGAASDTKGFVRALTRLSSDAARFITGLFPGNIDLVYAIGNRSAEREAIEAVFDDFAPPAIWKRLPAILNALIQKDKRFRLAVTLWARLRGVDIKPDQVRGVGKLLEAKTTAPLLERLVAHADKRRALLEHDTAHAPLFTALRTALEVSGQAP